MCSEGYTNYTIINAEFSMQLIALINKLSKITCANIMPKLC